MRGASRGDLLALNQLAMRKVGLSLAPSGFLLPFDRTMNALDARIQSGRFCSGSNRAFEPVRCYFGQSSPRTYAQSQPEGQSKKTPFSNIQPKWHQRRRSQHSPPPAWSVYSLPEAQAESVPVEFSDKYFLRRLLGKGSFGTVRSAVDKKTGLEWAVKVMPKNLPGKDPERILTRIREEVEVLEMLQSRPEALKLHEVIEDDQTLCIVTEVCYGGDLEHMLKERVCLTEVEVAPIIHAALQVLEKCHRHGICYGDIKPANFLLKWPYPSAADPQALPNIRIADFGCAQYLAPGVQKKQSGTPLYVAPEAFMQTSGLESDMWSLGMLFYQLLCGRLPFADSFKSKHAMEVMMAILSEDVKFEGPHWRCISEDARSLIMRMLDRDPNARVNPGDALLDPWMTRHYWSDHHREVKDEVWDNPPRFCTAGF